MQETSKPMDQVEQEAAELYKAHVGAAAVAEAIAIVTDARARGKKNLAYSSEMQRQIDADNELAHAGIEVDVMQPTVDAGEKHLKDNNEAYHRLAAVEDYERTEQQ